MKPGASTRPRASRRSRAASPAPMPTAVMRPPDTATPLGRAGAPVPSTMRALSITRSCMGSPLRGSLANEAADVPDPHRPGQALHGDRAHVLRLDQPLHRGRALGGDVHVAGRGLGAQARGEIGDRADGRVVPSPLEADGADRGVALGDADAGAEVPAPLAPA